MIKKKVTAFFLIFFLPLLLIYSQSKEESVPLSVIIAEIEQKFGCSFSYRDIDIEEIVLNRPKDSYNLKEAVAYLEKSTHLNWFFLNESTIAVSQHKNIQVCGILKSIVSNKIIANATVQSENDAVISNEKGEFSIQVNDLDSSLKIRCVGYATLQINIKDLFKRIPCKTIVLTPEIQNLNEVLLRNYLVKGIDKKSDGSIYIDFDDFGILPGLLEPDLLQTIQALPGVSSVEETVADINVRGGTNDQNLILWDGIKMYQSSHFFGLISAFNPYFTQHVTLFKNGTNARFGEGVSSVISMNTSDELVEKSNTSAGINMISSDAYIDTRLGDKSSLQLSVRKSINDIFETPTYKKYFEKAFQDSEIVNSNENMFITNDNFSFYDASARWLYQITPKDLVKVNALLIRNDLDFKENVMFDQQNVERESALAQNNNAASIKYYRKWNDVFDSDLLIYGTRYLLEAINSDIINDQRLLQENEVLEGGIMLNTSYQLNPFLKLESGYQFTETGVTNLRDVNNPIFRERVKEVLRVHSVFSEGSYVSRYDKAYLRLGLRLNYFDKFSSIRVEPRFSFNYKLNSRFTIEVLGELKSQTTSQIIESQNDFLGIENKKWVLSNDIDIPIIKSQQVSTGITYNHRNWFMSAELYFKNVNGIIIQSQGFQNQLEFESGHGSYDVRGGDFLINKRNKDVSAWLSYSYADNIYSFDNLAKPNFPNTIDIRHTLNLGISYTIKDVKFSSGINWHSGTPTTKPIFDDPISSDNTINYQHPNSDVLSNYFRWDSSITYTFRLSKKINGFFGVSVWNILNKENVVNNYYRINSENMVQEIKQLGLSLTPNAVFRVNF
ncbi:TonB-dependent receptor [Aquimarina pacifica]|uniref:TonB-dependent receptor n=1 Tax=Aquimarina pacifica TaxID=1296415 RepID=UPI0004BA6B98|nr:TonB-dependent receptor [Aquimarina pacifica]